MPWCSLLECEVRWCRSPRGSFSAWPWDSAIALASCLSSGESFPRVNGEREGASVPGPKPERDGMQCGDRLDFPLSLSLFLLVLGKYYYCSFPASIFCCCWQGRAGYPMMT